MFEAKIANGNGEQTLSRDIYRLGHRFDFFRMMSCYFTTVGFYFSTLVLFPSVLVKYHATCSDLIHIITVFTDYGSHCLYLPLWTSLSCFEWARARIKYTERHPRQYTFANSSSFTVFCSDWFPDGFTYAHGNWTGEGF